MNLSSLQRTQQQLIQVKSIEEFGIFGIIPASLVLSKVCFRSEKKNILRKKLKIKPLQEKVSQQHNYYPHGSRDGLSYGSIKYFL